MDRDKMSNLQRGPSIDVSYQVSLPLAEEFQRKRLKCEKLTDDRRRTPSDGKSSHCLRTTERRMPSDGKSSHCLWQGELKMIFQIYKLINIFILVVWFGLWCLMPLSTIFQLYRSGGRNRSTQRKPFSFWYLVCDITCTIKPLLLDYQSSAFSITALAWFIKYHRNTCSNLI